MIILQRPQRFSFLVIATEVTEATERYFLATEVTERYFF